MSRPVGRYTVEYSGSQVLAHAVRSAGRGSAGHRVTVTARDEAEACRVAALRVGGSGHRVVGRVL
jgi:hypothetical protein